MGRYNMVDLVYEEQVLLWACPTPTKSNCRCCLQTAGGVPTPHGSAVKSQRFFFLFLLHILYRALLLQCCICFIFKPQHCSLGVIVYLYWIFHINEISIVLDVKKEKVECLASTYKNCDLSGKLPKRTKCIYIYIYIKEFISYLVSTS